MFIIQCPILWYAKVCALPSAHSSLLLFLRGLTSQRTDRRLLSIRHAAAAAGSLERRRRRLCSHNDKNFRLVFKTQACRLFDRQQRSNHRSEYLKCPSAVMSSQTRSDLPFLSSCLQVDRRDTNLARNYYLFITVTNETSDLWLGQIHSVN